MTDQGGMRDVKVSVGGQLYAMACESGQEQRLTELAAILDSRYQALKQDCPGIAEKHLLVMVGILLCDDLDILRQQLAGRDQQEKDRDTAHLAELDLWKSREKDNAQAIQERIVHLKTLIEKLEGDGRL